MCTFYGLFFMGLVLCIPFEYSIYVQSGDYSTWLWEGGGGCQGVCVFVKMYNQI